MPIVGFVSEVDETRRAKLEVTTSRVQYLPAQFDCSDDNTKEVCRSLLGDRVFGNQGRRLVRFSELNVSRSDP